MSLAVDRAMGASALDFRERVWPIVSRYLGGGDLIPVEAVTDSLFAKLLDSQAGIDGWQLVGSGGIRGIASRIQWGATCWRSWTIRTRTTSGARTEYDKLVDADGTLLRPAYHVQAYLDQRGGAVLAAGCIRTNDLIRLLLAGRHGPERRNPTDGTYFVPVWWDDAASDYEVWRWEA